MRTPGDNTCIYASSILCIGKQAARTSRMRHLLAATILACGGIAMPAQAACVLTSGVYVCSGQSTVPEMGLMFGAFSRTVVTAPGFGIDLASADGLPALQISGRGQFIYIDTNASILDARGAGLAADFPTRALQLSVGGSDSADDLLFVRSNGDFFANRGETVVISGQGGQPELGFIDVELTGNIVRGESLPVAKACHEL